MSESRGNHEGDDAGDSRVAEISAEISDGCESASTGNPQASPHLHAIWTELMSLKHLVENDHDHKLRRIETDLRWTMMLVGAQFITIIGTAISTLVGG